MLAEFTIKPTYMKAIAKKINDFWFGLEPGMTKEERKLATLFQLGYLVLPLSIFITWRLYDWQIISVVIGLVIQISWQVYFAIILKRKRKQRLLH